MYKGFNVKRNAFSLMELMIVIVILGLLASLIMPSILGKSDEAKEKLVCIQMKSIKNAIKMFKVDNGTYPSTEEGLEALKENPDVEKYKSYARGGYFEEGTIPKDSWGNDFIYLNEDGEIELISFGGDGKEGGKKDGADITYSGCLKQ